MIKFAEGMAKVFISYSKRDDVVDTVVKALNDNGISYWIDREGLDGGVTFAERISKNIKDCDVFLFLSTENANSSPWTLREISTAIDFGKTVLPVRFDHSPYADSVALYLSSVQYIDWLELGEEESLRRIVSRVKGEKSDSERRFEAPKLPVFTKVVLHVAILFLVFIYAALTYQFLWSRALRSSEYMGGLVGYVCEFGVLLSIYYLVRILRLRRCNFIFPLLLTAIVFLAGMVLEDADLMFSAVLLLGGWVGVIFVCFLGRDRSFFKLMSKEHIFMKATDPENIIFVYLFIKVVILVLAHYFHISMKHSLISPLVF